MKNLLSAIAISLLLFSCTIGREIQVERLMGKATGIDTLYRFNGPIKRIEWTVERIKMYQYVSCGYAVTLGEYQVFMLNR